MRRILSFGFMFAIISFLVLTQAIAQESRFPELEVVSSPIIEDVSVTNQAVQVTTVTEKQIEAMNAFDLPSALRRVPGVTITRYNLIGSYGGAAGGAIYLRGMGAERPGAEIQTLIDGRPVFQGIFTHPLMDLPEIDIDIVKSSHLTGEG